MKKLLLIVLLLISPLAGAQTCTLFTGPIHSLHPGNSIESDALIGTATISLDPAQQQFIVDLAMNLGRLSPNDGWVISQIGVHAEEGTVPPPTDSGGAIRTFDFRYLPAVLPPNLMTASHRFFLPYEADFTPTCDEPVSLAMFGEFARFQNGQRIDSAFGFVRTDTPISLAFWTVADGQLPACGTPYTANIYGTFITNPENSLNTPTAHVIATATIGIDADSLNVSISPNATLLPTSNGWLFRGIRFFTGLGSNTPPLDPTTGAVSVATFPHAFDGLDQDTAIPFNFEVPLTAIGIVECGDAINLSLAITIARSVNGQSISNISGFLFGNQEVGYPVAGPFAGQTPSWWHVYQHRAPTEPPDLGCVRPAGYYKNHNALSKPSQRDPWPIGENTQICGITWLTAMQTKSNDAWYRLASEWITAMLNVADGALAPLQTLDYMTEADGRLRDACRTFTKKSGTYQRAKIVAGQLQAFNIGQRGVPVCPVP